MDEKLPAQAVEELTPLIQMLPPEGQKKVRQIIVAMATQFQGPLPPPELLEHYDKIIPNGANRLMMLLEKQTDHRISMESKLVGSRVGITERGQLIATGLSVFFGLVAAFLGYTGHDWLGGSIGVTTIIGLAVVFVLGREPGQRDTTDGKDTTPPKRSPPTNKKRRP